MTEQTTQLEHLATTDAWKQWEGQTVNGELPLHRYLGGSSHSAVFLTNCGEGDAQTAAIKLILDEPGKTEQQLKNWALAAGLSHPNLLQIFQAGRCQLDGFELLYVVMEYAEEDLSQILPQRVLTPSEAREMLRPAVDALAYLHGMGFVHGHIKPANIMACGDHVKLSSDGLILAGEPIDVPANLDTLDSYSSPDRKYSTASDAWALGMTLVEVLTQQLPAWERSVKEAEPVVPDTLAEPFFQIARRCLRRNPSLRLKASDIASRLEPLPAQELPEIAKSTETPGESHYFAWVIAIGLLLTAIMASSIRRKHHHHARQMPTSALVEKPKSEAPAEPLATEEAPAPNPASSIPEAAAESGPAAEVSGNRGTAAETKPQAPVQLAEETKVPVAAAEAVKNEAVAQSEEIHQELPDVPQKALGTIHGTVRVSVKVSVDPAGRVTEAALDFAGPSRYFANLALQAALRWSFGPASATSANNPRAWILHFEFTPTEKRARAVQAAP